MSGRAVQQSQITIKKISKKKEVSEQKEKKKELPTEVPPTEAPSNTPVEEQVQSVENTSVEVAETSEVLFDLIEKEYLSIAESTKTLRILQKKLKNVLRKELKESKGSKKKVERTTPRVETKKPIIDSLATLMEVPKGTEMSRQEVHKFICKYIKEHQLQDSLDKKCFKADKALEAVLGKPKFKAHSTSDKISHSYTNLLKMLSSLFKQ
jgi:chromatin remodeling complex protein RSC6